jgi:hypothetical protein
MKYHVPRLEDATATLCGEMMFASTASGQTQIGTLVSPGGVPNCPTCRSIINHVQQNITSHYRYAPLKR